MKAFLCMAVLLPMVSFMPVSTGDLPKSVATVVEYNTGAVAYVMQISTAAKVNTTAFETRLKTEFGLNPLNNKELTTTLNGKEVKFNYSVRYKLTPEIDNVTLEILFDNYYSYATYNTLSLATYHGATVNGKPLDIAARTQPTIDSLFLRERTIVFTNPYNRFFNTNTRSSDIVRAFDETFNSGEGVEQFDYIFASNFRRTNVNTQDSGRNIELDYIYKFSDIDTDTGDIVVFDRFPNTPVWYGLTALGVVLAMLVFYVIVRSKNSTHLC